MRLGLLRVFDVPAQVVLPWLYMADCFLPFSAFLCRSYPELSSQLDVVNDKRVPIVIELSERALVLYLVFGSQSVQDSNPRSVSIQQLLHCNIVGLCFMLQLAFIYSGSQFLNIDGGFMTLPYTNYPTNMNDVPFTK